MNNSNECKLKELTLNIEDSAIRIKNNFKYKLFEVNEK